MNQCEKARRGSYQNSYTSGTFLLTEMESNRKSSDGSNTAWHQSAPYVSVNHKLSPIMLGAQEESRI